MKVTLVGSTRFHERFKEINAKLSKLGHVVYSVALAEKAGDVITPAEKITLDLVHMKKIIESEAIVVIGYQPDGTYYIGESTRREIEWAMINGKSIYAERAFSFSKQRPISVEESELFEHSINEFLERLNKCQSPPLVQPGGAA
jgi:hypothetical protein